MELLNRGRHHDFTENKKGKGMNAEGMHRGQGFKKKKKIWGRDDCRVTPLQSVKRLYTEGKYTFIL